MTTTDAPLSIPVTTRAAAKALTVPERTIRMLRDAGLLTLDAAAVQAAAGRLQQIPPALPAGQPVLRVQPHRPKSPDSWDGPRALGYSTDLDDNTQLEALRQWWRCDPDAIIKAGLLIVTVAEIVVALVSVDRLSATIGNRQDKRHQFAATWGARLDRLGLPPRVITPTHGPIGASILGTRCPTQSGGPIAYAGSYPVQQ